MLYIIGGTSRSGKTIVARNIAEQTKIPCFPLDCLVMGFTNGMPEIGIHDKLFPDEIALKMWNFTEAMCENLIWVGSDMILEGEAILPEQAYKLLQKHPEKIKVCFVGYTEIDVIEKVKNIQQYRSSTNDWLCNEPEETIFEHVNNMLSFSKKISEDCKKYGIHYIDTSVNFSETLKLTAKYLINDSSKK